MANCIYIPGAGQIGVGGQVGIGQETGVGEGQVVGFGGQSVTSIRNMPSKIVKMICTLQHNIHKAHLQQQLFQKNYYKPLNCSLIESKIE